MPTDRVKDFVKDQAEIYQPATEPVIIEIPEMTFLMMDGEGAPDPDQGTYGDISEFQHAVGALYGIAYSVKMSPKKGQQPDGFYEFKVPPLEALWWMKDNGEFDVVKRDQWCWRVMLRMPEYCTPQVTKRFAEQMVNKKKDEIYRRVRLEKFTEGLCVQLMYIGSYAEEGPAIQKMHEFIAAQDFKPAGKHHEIYFGDPRRTAPEKLRTILRQPVIK